MTPPKNTQECKEKWGCECPFHNDVSSSTEDWEAEFGQTFHNVGWIPENKERILDFIRTKKHEWEAAERAKKAEYRQSFIDGRSSLKEELIEKLTAMLPEAHANWCGHEFCDVCVKERTVNDAIAIIKVA